MGYLLDTHSFLWFLGGNKSLSESAFLIISDLKNKTYFSITSIWEVGIKVSFG